MPLSRIGTNSITDASITTGDLANTLSISANTGSASAPAIFPTGDNNTGIFFPAADTIAFSEGGTESMRIDSAGIVTGTAGNLMLISGTAVDSNSGTSIDFTGIPSWVKRVTVMFNGVSTNGTSIIQMQLGDSGGVETTGYTAGSGSFGGSAFAATSFTTGFGIRTSNAAANDYQGFVTFINLSANIWVANGSTYAASGYFLAPFGGSKTLSATLDRIRITTVNGTDTFDAGSINILYE